MYNVYHAISVFLITQRLSTKRFLFGRFIQVGTVYQLVVTISILISQILGLDYILGTADFWPVLLALIIAPAIFMFVTLPFCPESPKYTLINKKKDIEAERGNHHNT